MKTIPIEDLGNTTALERLCAEAGGPVFVTKNGQRRLVIMEVDGFERIMQMIYEASRIIEGLEDIQTGRIVDGEQAISDIRTKYGI